MKGKNRSFPHRTGRFSTISTLRNVENSKLSFSVFCKNRLHFRGFAYPVSERSFCPFFSVSCFVKIIASYFSFRFFPFSREQNFRLSRLFACGGYGYLFSRYGRPLPSSYDPPRGESARRRRRRYARACSSFFLRSGRGRAFFSLYGKSSLYSSSFL